MRHETAVRRLRAIAARCQRVSGLYEDDPFLIAAYAFGAVLDAPADLPVVQVAFVLGLPAEELTWCAQPQSCVGLPQLLEIEKAPVEWWLRPSVWPVANHAIRRPLRVWSLDGGPDLAALDALAHGEADALRVPDPPSAHLRAQLAAELAASRTHLRAVEATYWDDDWRSSNRGYGIYPEHHLWEAVHGYIDLLDAITAFPPDHHDQELAPVEKFR